MDTSKQYINMCKKAPEIQEYFRCVNKDIGCFVYIFNIQSVDCIPHKFRYREEAGFYLPRQDQLQDMIKDHTKAALLRKCYIDVYNNNRDLYYEHVESMERIWLVFIMREKYNKIWKDNKWIKIK